MPDAREDFEKVAKAYTKGKGNLKDVERAYQKMIRQNEKQSVDGINLDFVDIEDYKNDREREMKTVVNSVSDPYSLSKKGWEFLKKEAGVSSSGFMKKADANVGKYLSTYKKDHDRWISSMSVTPGGDAKLTQKLLKSCRELRTSLDNFVTAKDFKAELETGLAKKLRKMCLRMCASLDTTERQLLASLADQDKGRRDMVNMLKKAGLY